MDIQTNTAGRKVNRYSDFSVSMSFTKDGVEYMPDSFILVFYVDNLDDCSSRYVASYINGEAVNCKVPTSGSAITVFFNQPGFNIGLLKCRVFDIVDDSDFSDGTLDTCTPITLPVEIVAGAGDTDSMELGDFEINTGGNGVGIADISVVESDEDGGYNVITITLTNGETVTFNVKNGSKGYGISPETQQAILEGLERIKGLPMHRFLSASEYEALVNADEVDPDTIYLTYEDE